MAIAPISGKLGKVTWNGNSLYLEKWDLNVKIAAERYRTFEQTPDASPTPAYWSQVMTGFAEGTAKVTGKFDNTPGSYLPSNKVVWIGQVATGSLIIGGTVGFNITGTIVDITASQGVESPFGTYDATIEVTACAFVTS